MHRIYSRVVESYLREKYSSSREYFILFLESDPYLYIRELALQELEEISDQYSGGRISLKNYAPSRDFQKLNSVLENFCHNSTEWYSDGASNQLYDLFYDNSSIPRVEGKVGSDTGELFGPFTSNFLESIPKFLISNEISAQKEELPKDFHSYMKRKNRNSIPKNSEINTSCKIKYNGSNKVRYDLVVSVSHLTDEDFKIGSSGWLTQLEKTLKKFAEEDYCYPTIGVFSNKWDFKASADSKEDSNGQITLYYLMKADFFFNYLS